MSVPSDVSTLWCQRIEQKSLNLCFILCSKYSASTFSVSFYCMWWWPDLMMSSLLLFVLLLGTIAQGNTLLCLGLTLSRTPAGHLKGAFLVNFCWIFWALELMSCYHLCLPIYLSPHPSSSLLSTHYYLFFCFSLLYTNSILLYYTWYTYSQLKSWWSRTYRTHVL